MWLLWAFLTLVAFRVVWGLLALVIEQGQARMMRVLGLGAFEAKCGAWDAADVRYIPCGVAEVAEDAWRLGQLAWAWLSERAADLWAYAKAWLPKKREITGDTAATLVQLQEAEVQVANGFDEFAPQLALSLRSLQNEIGVLAQRGHERTADETWRFVHLTQQLRDHEARTIARLTDPTPARAAQGLLGGVVSAGLGKYALIAGAAALAFGGLQTVRLEHAKGDLKEARADRDEARRSIGVYKTRVGKLRDTVSALGVKCETESREAADRRAAQEARARTAAQRARIKLNEAAANLGVGEPFNLSDRLRDLSAPAASPGTAAPESVASGVPGNPSPDPTAPSGGEPTSR